MGTTVMIREASLQLKDCWFEALTRKDQKGIWHTHT